MKCMFWKMAAITAAAILFLSGCPNPTQNPKTGNTSVSFTGLTADGSATDTTTKLTMTFNRDIEGLSAPDVTLAAGTTGAVKDALTRTGTGVYELALIDIAASGTVTVSVAKLGYEITGGQKTVAVYQYTPPADIAVSFTGLTADGSVMVTTTKLTMTFNRDIEGLSAEDVTLAAGTTGAVKGALTRTGTGVYELALIDIAASGTVTVSVAKSGYEITGGQKTAAVYQYTPPADIAVSFTGLTADGSATDTTTKLTLSFDMDIEGLSAVDVTLAGAVKGELTRTETGVYELPLTSIITSGTVTVSVAKSGYAFSPDNRIVTIYAWGDTTLTITFSQIADNAPSIIGPTLYRVSNGGPTGATLTVDNPEQYDSVSWRVQNTTVTGTGQSFTLSAANTAYNLIGEHFVTVLVMVGGVPYNKTVSFKVEY